MHPELFEIPFLHISVKSYGTLMVIGFLVAVWLMRQIMKGLGQDPDRISSIAMYTLLSGIIGARIFYVIHHNDMFTGRPMEAFAVWQGGLELLGGVIVAIGFVWFYLWKFKLPKRLYLDILAIGLMVGLGFGRLGCLMNGCCYGKCTDVSWAVQFPYGSPAFYSQIGPDGARNRPEPLWDLPKDYYRDGYLRDFEELTEEQKTAVKHGGLYCTRPVHPTQIYSSIGAFILAGVLYGIWRMIGKRKPGVVLSCMFILYGPVRFWLETLRDDNPFETAWWAIYKGGTVSQNIGIYMFIAGVILLTVFAARKPEQIETKAQLKPKN
ncbi:MAG: prolipoprotein diacylglyceryl transferase [Planctomycetota bacterium]|jgi:phosphatidylglycerol:prolipoprotein diacylglycerol transferase